MTTVLRKPKVLTPASFLPLLPAAVAIISLASLLLVAENGRVASAGYDLQRLETIKDQWKEKNRLLDAEIGYLGSLRRVEAEARGRLKMGPATDPTYVVVNVPSQRQTPGTQATAAAQSSTWIDRWGRLWRLITDWD